VAPRQRHALEKARYGRASAARYGDCADDDPLVLRNDLFHIAHGNNDDPPPEQTTSHDELVWTVLA
jgi:hypothetical protein